MKIGILGFGIVGKATQQGLGIKDPIIHDILSNTKFEDLKVCDYVFVCIPTSSQQDIENLIVEVKNLKNQNPEQTIIIRSTLPVGTSAKLGFNVYYMPEFLRERCWQEDCYNRPFIVGSIDGSIPSLLNPDECVLCSLEEAEIIKMFSNNIASARVVLANHFYEIANSFEADYNKIVDSYFKVNHDQNYLNVSESLRGFGGKCLPKDLDLLIQTMQDLSLPQTFFTAVKEDNKLWPTTVRKS